MARLGWEAPAHPDGAQKQAVGSSLFRRRNDANLGVGGRWSATLAGAMILGGTPSDFGVSALRLLFASVRILRSAFLAVP